ncbi:MAG TPA: serine hydrolase domain-containing protein, partial [Candidatus Sulfopaludibacter sp.]|nr:serine hydrolase domain-containing protein [Candidatus Sulfopaludibacter sp.]
MQAVLDRDLAPALRPSGLLDPANGMGVTIGVLTQGERRVFTYGAAKPDSIFEIASISKTFTATVLAQMVEQGRVRLDEPVRELLPPGTVEKPEGREITLIDLATHHSGLPRTAGNIRPDGNANADYTPADLFAYIGRHGVRKPPDASFSYSNLGFALLGQALANRAGMSYADLVKQVVTGPLGLRDTAVTLDAERQARLITGHRLGGDAVEPWVLDAQAPAGGIYSTAGDLLLYLDAQLHPERLAELGAAIRETHVLRADIGGMDVASESGVRLGMAWMHGARHGIYFHGGNARGETSLAFFSPAGDYAGVVLVNMTASPMEVVETLGQHLRRRLAGEAPLSFAQVVVPAGGGLGGWLRSLAAYWLTMLASGAFLFCCVLALQGLAAQLLPRRMFLRMSSFLQMGAFCLFVCGYFLQPLFATPDTLTAATNGGVLVWSPSYWFLGLFQALNGSPALAPLARRAMIALPVAIGSAAISYLLCYVRTLRKIVEEPDILPGARGVRWLPAFGNRFDTAVA